MILIMFILITILYLLYSCSYHEEFKNIYNKYRFYDKLDFVIGNYDCKKIYKSPTVFTRTYNFPNLNFNINSIKINSDIFSFSFEQSSAHAMLADPNGNRRNSFYKLMTFLKDTAKSSKGMNIRIGAATGEYNQIDINSPRLETYKYVKDFNGTVTGMIPLHYDDIPYAISLGKKYKELLGNTLDLIEMGNEPDYTWEHMDAAVFQGNPGDYDKFKLYENVLKKHIDAFGKDTLLKNVPLMIGSMASGKWLNYLLTNINYYKSKSNVKVICFHQYSGCNCGEKDKANPRKDNTIPKLLANTATGNRYSDQNKIVSNRKLEFHMGEGNTICCSGQFNISDTFASTLYWIDYCLNLLKLGVQRINLHTGPIPNIIYSAIIYPDTFKDIPFDTQIQIRPIFYAIWFLYFLIQNNASLCKEENDVSSFIKKWLFKNSEDSKLAILHLGERNNLKISIKAINNKDAKLIRLISRNGVTGKSGITFGNLTFDGTIDGTPMKCIDNKLLQSTDYNYENISNKNGSYEFIIEPHSAVILIL